FALEETELFPQYPRLRAHGRSRMLAAAVAMTMTRLQKRGSTSKRTPPHRQLPRIGFFMRNYKIRLGLVRIRDCQSYSQSAFNAWICGWNRRHNRMTEVS